MRASLPMYDWPEVTAETDRFWTVLREALAEAGISAPVMLERGGDLWEVWRAPTLVLSQCCGISIAEALRGQVAVVGAFDFGLEGCAPGQYRSLIVAKPGSDWAELAARGVPACNETSSQSGYRVLRGTAQRLGEARMTGAHRASIQAVAAGLADYAAIDARCWDLALAHEPAVAELEVLAAMAPTPGVPVIAPLGADLGAYRMAVAEAVAALDAPARAALGIAGFVASDNAAYEAAFGGAGRSGVQTTSAASR